MAAPRSDDATALVRDAGGTARLDTWLWIAQRASAAVLGLCVAVHLATIILAVRGGLSGAEIVGRVGGSTVWLLFYALFVLALAVHAPVGVRAILRENTRLAPVAVDALCALLGLFLLLAGLDAALALYGADT